MQDKRVTIRFNAREQVELQLFKETYHLESDSDAMKCALQWCNSYLKNVTELLFPPNYDVILCKKKKTQQMKRKVWE